MSCSIKCNMKLTISRVCNSKSSKEEIRIMLLDENSRVRVIDGILSLEDFAKAITGLGYVDVSVEVDTVDLFFVGKKKIIEERSIYCPLAYFSDKNLFSAWLKDNAQEEGWYLDTYLGSQASIKSNAPNGCTLHYHVYKYVD